MQEINKLDALSIIEENVFKEIYEESDEFKQAAVLMTLMDRAKALGVKQKFETMYKAYKKEQDKKAKSLPQPMQYQSHSGMTEFNSKYDEFRCGKWICNDNGVRTFSLFTGQEIIACHHPIIPIQRLINIETNREKIRLAYKRKSKWRELIVDKGIVAASTKIVQLAEQGIGVTSENAKHLVSYLSDIENFNIDKIEAKNSTSKLGWHMDEFVPYGRDLYFDGEAKYKEAYESISEKGSEDTWLEIARSIRRSSRIEPKIYLTGAFASVLVGPLNALPFIINLWGETGKGKTVALMLAASVWAYPGENAYITDPKSTPTALELRLDFLNNLPMLIDDMAQIKERVSGDFSSLVYMLCSGRGKDRANQSLGLNKSTGWRNAILTNAEHSLVTETMQGGAINRIIDVEMEEGYIFENGNAVVQTLNENYGFAGRRFLEAIDEIGLEEIKRKQQKAYRGIVERAKELGVEKEEKQILPMSILLTADLVATDYIFKDGQYLDLNFCVDLLKNKGEVSENERAYDYIMSEIAINMNKFKPDKNTGEYRGEIWGAIEKGYVYIMSNIFNRICEKGNFSRKSFLTWAEKKSLLDVGGSGKTKRKRLDGSLSWCICLKLPDSITDSNDKRDLRTDEDGFVTLSEDEQEELPFL